jgi:hypothetical protein
VLVNGPRDSSRRARTTVRGDRLHGPRGRIGEIDILADPARLGALDLTVLDG